MKKIVYLFLFGLLSFASCQKDILDKQPLDIISDASVWTDQALINGILTQAYAQTVVMTLDVVGYHEGWNGFGGDWGNIPRSDSYDGFDTVLGMSDDARNQWNFSIYPTTMKEAQTISSYLLPWWENPYNIIRSLNDFIVKLPASTAVDAAFIKQRVAEARFLRAFNYFYMVKRYGGVPLITKAQGLDDPDLYPKRDSEQACYDFVISEIDAIANDLPETVAASDYGRPTKYAALALKCRAALYAGSIAQFGTVQLNGLLGIPAASSAPYYQKSYDAAKAIITSGKFALYNADANKVKNFQNIFLVERNSEAIFVKPYGGSVYNFDSNTGNTWSWDFLNCPKPQAWGAGNATIPYLETAEEFEYVDGTPGTLDRTAITKKLWTMNELWGNKDPRFFATLYTMGTPWKGITIDWHDALLLPDGTTLTANEDTYNGVPARGFQPKNWMYGTGFGVMKYLDENTNNMNWLCESRTDFIVFRYGEVLLNLAEAAFELGKTGEALDAVNQIRTRAGIATLGAVTREKIRHERFVELAFEGNRYWDLCRWRIAESKIPVNRSGLRYILDYTTGKYKLEIIANIDGLTTTPTFFSRNYYFPIMLHRTGANKNLVENPGYN